MGIANEIPTPERYRACLAELKALLMAERDFYTLAKIGYEIMVIFSIVGDPQQLTEVKK